MIETRMARRSDSVPSQPAVPAPESGRVLNSFKAAVLLRHAAGVTAEEQLLVAELVAVAQREQLREDGEPGVGLAQCLPRDPIRHLLGVPGVDMLGLQSRDRALHLVVGVPDRQSAKREERAQPRPVGRMYADTARA